MFESDCYSPDPVRPSGKVNLIGLLMLSGLIFGGWWGFLFLPNQIDHLDVKEAVDVAFTEGKNGEAMVRSKLLNRINYSNFGTHVEVDPETQEEVVKPGLGFTDENVQIELNEEKKTLRIAVDYDRDVHMKPLKRIKRVHYHYEKSGKFL